MGRTEADGEQGALTERLAFTRFELADAVRSRWLGITLTLYTLVFAAFVSLGLRESSVLGFTGLSRVVLNVTNGVLAAVPLLVLLSTSQVVVRARRSGLLELLLTQPTTRGAWFFGVVVSRALVLLSPLLLMFGAAVTFGFGEEGLAAVVARCLLISVSLGFAYLGLGLLVSTLARTPERALVGALTVWLVATALHDFLLIGVLLQTRLPPRLVFVLAALNPTEAARVGILSSVDPDLSVLGPVGFWLANTLGASRALWLAIGWPTLLGVASLAFAAHKLDRTDAVA